MMSSSKWWSHFGLFGMLRKVIHEVIFKSPLSTHCFINSFLCEIHILEKPASTSTRSAHPRPNHWLAPPNGLCKINVDATLTRNRSIGAVGAVCRDHLEDFLGASTIVFVWMEDPIALEALAVREALALDGDLYVH